MLINSKPTILIAPLDWGLGHTTRCMIIIRSLLKNNYKVIVAVNRQQQSLLQQEFASQISYTYLSGYNINYTKHPQFFNLKIIAQIPRIFWAIYSEKKWLKNYVNKNDVDLVISDNRYGLASKSVPSVFITHQLLIKSNSNIIEKLLQKINYTFINKFTQCWLPDDAQNNIAGVLSNPKITPLVSIKNIGVLSRFTHKISSDTFYDICFLISGPEPQRSKFEQIICRQIEAIKSKKIVLIRGLPHNASQLQISNVEVVNHLPEKDLQQIVQQSKLVIARSGYTTIMELIALKKDMILVPTQGQTEQEYLAKYLSEKNICLTVTQNKFNLSQLISEAENFCFKKIINIGFNETEMLNSICEMV